MPINNSSRASKNGLKYTPFIDAAVNHSKKSFIVSVPGRQLLRADDVALALDLLLDVVDSVVDDPRLVVGQASSPPEQLLNLVQRFSLGFRNKNCAENEDDDQDGAEAPEDGSRADGLCQRPEALSDYEAQRPVEGSWKV